MHRRAPGRPRLLSGVMIAGTFSLTLGLTGCGGGGSSASNSSAPVSDSAGGVTGSSSSKAITPATYTIGGGITGLAGDGLTLANGSDAISPSAGDQSFTFNTAVPAGTPYDVTVQLQPAGQTCVVTGGSGVVGSGDINDVQVGCAATTFTIGGGMSGLTGTGLVLANGTDSVSPAAGVTTFTFPTSVLTATSFNVTVASQPSGETCAVSNGAGVTLTSSVSNVSVACTTVAQ